MNFVFKIFGAPHTFDLFQGIGNEISYFQTFDNASKENVKFVINRMEREQVSYSYLRYNFISGGGRGKSFFGMSVVFNKEYCTDIKNLYKLFDSVYKTILKSKILIEEIENNPNAQAKYLVRSFAEDENEVRRIESIICKNIENEFKADINQLPPNIENSNLIRKLNDKKGNDVFLKAFYKYSWVSISPEYNDEEGLSPEIIEPIKERIKYLRENLSSIIINKKVESTREQIDKDKTSIKPYLQIQSELQEVNKDLNNIQKQLSDLNTVISENMTNTAPTSDLTNATFQSPTSTPSKAQSGIINPFWQYCKIYLRVLVILLIILVGTVGVFKYYPNKSAKESVKRENKIPAQDIIENLVMKGNDALNKNDFNQAINKFKQAGRPDLVNIVKSKAIEYWNGKAANEKNPKDAITYLEKTRVYDNNPDKDIAEFKKQINKTEKAPKQKEQQKPKKETENKTTTDTPIIISIKKNGLVVYGFEYSIGDKLEITANQDHSPHQSGKWTSDNNIKMSDPNDNPVTVEIKKVGTCTLSYKVGDVEKAKIVLTIKNRAANI